jgi:hypothetical protein
LFQVRYGLVLAPGRVTLSPLGPTNFSYHVGNVQVRPSPFLPFTYFALCSPCVSPAFAILLACIPLFQRRSLRKHTPN